MHKNVLSILQVNDELIGAVCAVSSKRVTLRHLCRVRYKRSPDEAVPALLESIGMFTGNGGLLETRVCLSAEQALYRIWNFPFRSRNKAEQAIRLLLDSEFPFENSTLVHRLFFTAFGSSKMPSTSALSITFPQTVPDSLLDALARQACFPTLVTVNPFPLLLALPAIEKKGVQLLLQLGDQHSVLTLLKEGIIKSICSVGIGRAFVNSRSIPQWGNKDPWYLLGEQLRREMDLMLEGVPFIPERALIHGDCPNSAKQVLAEGLRLPVEVLGQNLPLSRLICGLSEKQADCLSALALAALPAPGAWRKTAPSFHRSPAGEHKKHERLSIRIAAGFLLVAGAWLTSVWAEGYSSARVAAQWESRTQKLFQQAVPEIKGRFGLVQMESILRQRIGERQRSEKNDTASYALLFLRDIHAAVPPSLDIQLDTINMDARRCGLTGTAGTYEQVDSFRALLAALPGVGDVHLLNATSRKTNKTMDNRRQSALPLRVEPRIAFEIELISQRRPE